MSELFKSEFFTDEATVYNLKDSMWLGKPSKSNEWWFGVQNTDATDDERKEAAEFIANAINTHDTMQSRIVELEAEVEKTVYAYSMVLDHATGGELSKAYFDHEMVCKAIDKHYRLNEDENTKETVEVAVEDMAGRVVELEGVVSDLLLGSNHEFLTINAIRINAQKVLKDNS